MDHPSKLTWAAIGGVRGYSKKPELLTLDRGAVVIGMDGGNLPLVPAEVANFAHVLHVPERHFEAGTIRMKVLPPVNNLVGDGETEEEAMLRIFEEIRVMTLERLQEISSNE